MKTCPLVVVVLGALAARVARADSAPPRSPSLSPVEAAPRARLEPWLLVTQGVAAEAVSIISFTQALSSHSTGRTLSIAAVTPLVVGGVVCAVGKFSDRAEGSCWPALAGAYLGAATAIPLVYLGAALDNSGEPSQSDVHLPFLTVVLPAIAWFMLQPSAAVGGWLLFAHERAGGLVLNPAPLPPPPRPAFAPERPRGLALAPGERSLPLLSVGF